MVFAARNSQHGIPEAADRFPQGRLTSNWTRQMTSNAILRKIGLAFYLALLTFAPSVAFADFPVVTNFPDTGFYQARTLQDVNNVTVMELTGNYDMRTAAGDPNVEPRTVIAKEFYRLHPDHYDFIVVFSNFEFNTAEFKAFHLGVQNKVKGLGLSQFDYTSSFGSKGKLLGYIDMAALTRYVTDPYDAQFETVMQTFSHEFLHQWGIGSHILAADGSLSNALLGPQGAHWSYLLNSDASVEYGNEWRDNGDGTFTSIASRQFYSPLDLYLMGMYKKSEVPPFYLIKNPSVDPTQYPLTGATVTGTRQDLTIDDVIAADGARVPDASTSQKTFRLGFIVLGRSGADPTAAQIAAVNNIRLALESRMSALTGGRAMMQTYLDTTGGSPGTPAGGGTAGAVRTGAASVIDGKAWLRAKQAADGSWSDIGFTTLRDTTVAFSTLTDIDAANFVGGPKALSWLGAQSSSNTDYQARRILALFRGGVSAGSDVTNLVGTQNADGGWGAAQGYQSNPVDTALAVSGLQPYSSTVPTAVIQSALAYLTASQNADGGWGNVGSGVSRTAATATVLTAFSGSSQVSGIATKAFAFLAARQNADGGFGDGGTSTIHDTANVIQALLTQNALGSVRSSDAISYVSSTQHTDGSWDGTVYSTALALRMLSNAAIFNWTVTGLTATPAAPLDGQQTLLSFTVSNNGAQTAPNGIVRVYDGDPSKGGVQIGQDINVPGLAPAQNIALNQPWDTTNKAGSHTLYAVVDPDNTVAEGSKSDNRAMLPITVAAAPQLADLVVNSANIVVTPQHPTKIPTTLSITAQVQNIGQTDANSVQIVLTTTTGGKTQIVDQKTVNLLGRSTQAVNFSAVLSNAGITQYTITLDPNNLITQASRSGDSATVSVQSVAALDLGLQASDMSVTTSPVLLGSDAQFGVTIHNFGTQDSPPFNVAYSVTDGTNTAQVATHQLQLASGASTQQQVVWRSTLSGNLTFVANVDPAGTLSESDRSNNVASIPFQVIAANGAELAVSYTDFTFNPSPILEAQPLTISQVVRNIGNVAATNVEVAFYDGDPSNGKMLGTLQVIPALAAGSTAPVSITVPKFPDAQSHLIFCVVDPNGKLTQVSRADNSTFIVVGAQSMPDLAISTADISAKPASPKPGDAISLTVTVNNLGQQPAANVAVRAYDGDPASGGTQIGTDQVIANFTGLSAQSVIFAVPASTASGNRSIFIVVDPDNAVNEKTKSNNTASISFIVQSGNFYITNRYFSPNGDGVLDDTTFSFHLPSQVNATVNVLNKRGVAVRSYSGSALNNVQDGTVTWDGLDSNGSVVSDGDYTLNVAAGGTVFGQVVVTLDTNRSSIIDAIDTKYQLFTNLSCVLNPAYSPPYPFVTADEQRLFLDNPIGSVQNVPAGLFVETTDISSLSALPAPPGATQQNPIWDQGYTASLNGEKVAVTYTPYNSNTTTLWVMNGDGSGLKQLNAQQTDATYGPLGSNSVLSADGTAFYGLVNGILESIPTDGVTAPTLLLQASDIGGSGASINGIDYSPDRSKALVGTYNGGQYSYYVVDMMTGRRNKIAVDLPPGYAYQKRKWAPNSKLFLMGGMLLNDLGTPAANPYDAGFFVYDQEFNLIQSFQTNDGSSASNGYGGGISGGDWGGYGGAITDPDWSSNSLEFVFGHSFAVGNVVGEASTVTSNEPRAIIDNLVRDITQRTKSMVANGSYHIMTVAQVNTGQLLEIDSTQSSIYSPNDLPAGYKWAPNERTILRMRYYELCNQSSDSCIDAISLDDNNAIRNLFQNWQNAPDVQANPYGSGISVESFIPSGRKLLFSSSRDANNTASSCYQTGQDQYSYGSLLNMTADLRPLYNSNGGGLRLQGTAADMNFASYQIDYSTAAQPNTWIAVAPPSNSPVVNDVFTTWVPPAYGNYFLRLTVTDLAGNKLQQVHNVAWANTPSITDLYTDFNYISPNGDGVQDQVSLHYRVLQPVHLEFTVADATNTIIRTVPVDQYVIGTQTAFVWDGRDDKGIVVPDGQYSISVQNYQYFVTVDNTMPVVALTTYDAYQPQFTYPCSDLSCATVFEYLELNGYPIKTARIAQNLTDSYWTIVSNLSWSASDANFLSLLVESGQGATPSTWVDAGVGNGVTGSVELVDGQYVNTEYRLTAIDKAGNKAVTTATPSQQVFFIDYANHRQSNPPTDPTWLPAFPAPYVDPSTPVSGLPHLGGISSGNPLRISVVETMIQPTSTVVLQYKALAPTDASLKISDLDSLPWNEVTITNFVHADSTGFVSSGTTAGNSRFQFLWDMQGIQPETDYILRLKIVDAQGAALPVVNPYIFRLSNALQILNVDDQRNIQMTVKAIGSWTVPFTKIDLLLKSSTDPRYATPQIVETAQTPGILFSYFIGTELLQQLDMHLCESYSFVLRGTLSTGQVVTSPDWGLKPLCMGVDWSAIPQAAATCTATPSGKVAFNLMPFANDGRKLTQLLFGSIAADGTETLLNNWNDIQNGGSYPYSVDTTNLQDGSAKYFARLINEDAKQIDIGIPITVEHEPAILSVTSPVEGQKMCGIKVPDPQKPGAFRTVVPIQVSASDGATINYQTDFSVAATNAWQQINIGLVQQLDPFVLIPPPGTPAQPVQWSSKPIPGSNQPGVTAQSGEWAELGLYENINDLANGQQQLAVRARAFNAGGFQTCSAPVNFYFSNTISVTPSSIDYKIFSPNADGQFDVVTLALSPNEDVTVDIQVFPAQFDAASGKWSPIGAAVRNLVQAQAVPAGSASFQWDGNTDASSVAPDGNYLLRITYTDGCGNQLVEDQVTQLDNTPPAVTISSPFANAQLGLVVPLQGSITDLNFYSYQIQYALPSAPDAWVNIAASVKPTLSPAGTLQALGNWNTLGLSGPVTFRVLATDSVANITDLRIPVIINPAVVGLISYLDATPTPFSPNGDGKLDSLSVRYGLLNSATIDLEIWSTDSVPALVKTIVNNSAATAGAAVNTWDGTNNAGQKAPDGNYVAKLTAFAIAPNSGSETEQTQFALDNTPPTVSVSMPATSFANSQENITATISDLNLAGYQVYIASNPPQDNPSGANWQLVTQGTTAIANSIIAPLSGLAAGSYGIKVDASDTAQNSTEVIKYFQVDNTPPAVTLTGPVGGSYLSAFNGPVKVTGGIVDSYLSSYVLSFGPIGSAVASFTPLLNGTALPLPATLDNWDISKIPDGPYTLSLAAQNQAGLSGQASLNVIIDNTPPVAAITLPVQGSYITKSSDITGTATDANFNAYKLDIAPGTKATASLWSALGSGTAAVANGELLKWQALPPDGPATVRLTVTDKAGNTAVAYSEIIVDTKPPATPLNLVAQVQGGKDVQLTWNANTEPDLAGYILFRNGTAINQPTNLIATPSYLDAGLPTGNYAYTVVAVDKAGLQSPASNVANASVNLSAPVAQIFSPANGAIVSGLVNIQGTANDSAGFKQYVVSVGNGTAPTSWQVLRTSPVPTVADVLTQWNTLGLTENVPMTLKLEAQDIYGTVATSTVTVTVDNTAPNAPLQLTAVPNGANVTLNWTASSSPDTAGYIIYRDQFVANAPGVVVGSLKPYLIVPTNYVDLGVPNGNHAYYVLAMDKAGNTSGPSNTVNVTIHTGPPHMTIIQPAAGTVIGQTTYVLSTSPDTDIASVQFQYRLATDTTWTNMGAPVTQAPFGTNWNPSGLTYADYMVQAVATDTYGLTDPAPTPIKITYKNLQSPSIVIGVTALVNGNTVNLSWTASTATDLTGYLVDRVAPNATITRITSSPIAATTLPDAGLADGAYIYRVYAVNSANNLSKPSADTNALVFTPTVTQPYTPTANSSFALTGQGQPTTNVVVQAVDGANAGATIATFAANPDGSFAQPTIALAEGDNHYSLTQQDSAGNISNAATFHVLRGDPPASPTGLQGSVSGQTISLQWAANTESNLFGYRVNLNGTDVPQVATGATATASSTQPQYYWWQTNYSPYQVTDGNANTGWSPDNSQPAKGQWIALNYPAKVSLTQLQVVFEYWNVLSDFNIEAWDGQVWVPLASVTANTNPTLTTTFAQPYLTDKIRIKTVDNYGSPYIMEMKAIMLPSVTATNWSGDSPYGVQTVNVYAENNLGMYSAPASVKQGVGDVTPPDIGTISGTASGSSVNLSWTASVATDIAFYQVFRDGVPIYQTADATTLVYVDPSLANGTYVYTYTATNTSGTVSAVSAPAAVTVNVPIQVGAISLQVTAPAAGSLLNLNWTPPANGPISASYAIGRSTTAGGPYTPLADSLTATTYPDSAVTNSTTYYYVVTGTDTLGNVVAKSNEASGTPLDIQAPAAPVLFAPTVNGAPIVTQNPSADIVGLAEPGALVSLTRNNSVLAQATSPTTPEEIDSSVSVGYRPFDATQDGKTLAGIDYNNSLTTVDVASGTTTAITSPGSVYAAKWSHDGKSLAFVTYDSTVGDNVLMIYKIGDAAAVRISILTVATFDLGWSPDDTRIAVLGQDPNNTGGLWVVNLATQNTQNLASDDPSLFYAPSWSPDGKFISYSYNGAVRLVALADGSVTSVDAARSSSYASWSTDSSRLIYQFTDPNTGKQQVGQYVLATAATQTLSDPAMNSSYPHWLDGNFDYVDYENSALVEHAPDGTIVTTLSVSYVQQPQYAVTTPTGYLFYEEDAYYVIRISPAGVFRIPNQKLNVGENDFTAVATDSAGNVSPASLPISVTFSGGNLADLEADAGNITVLPSAPAIGTSTNVTAVVQNIGATAATNFVVALTVTDANGTVTQLANTTVASLDAGASMPITAPWTPAAAGSYSITVSADTGSVVTEVTKANNVAVAPITVAADTAPTITVKTDATSYAGNTPVNATITALNSGPTLSGTLKVWVEDANGYLVQNLPSMTVTNLAYGNSVIDPVVWNTGTTLSGAYRVVGQLVDAQSNPVATGKSTFAITSSLQLQAGIVADQAQYADNQNAKLTATFTLAAGNASLQDGSAVIQVSDSANNVLFTNTQATGTLLPGASSTINATWNTGSAAPATYVASVTVTSGGAQIASAQTNVVVVNTPTTQLTGTLALSANSVANGDQLTVNYGLTEAGTVNLTGLPVVVTIIDPVTQALIATSNGTANVAAGATIAGQAQFSVSGWPIKTLQVVLSSTVGGTAVTLQRATIQVINRSLPVAVVTKPAQGAYLNGATIPFVVQATSSASSIVKTEYSLDSSVWQPMALQDLANGLYGVSLASGADGPRTVYFRTTDATNNVSGTVTLNVIIDNTPPQIVVTGVADGQTYTSSATPAVTVTDANLTTSSILLDNVSFTSGTAVTADGAHVLQINAADKAGNTSSKTITFQVVPPIALGITQGLWNANRVLVLTACNDSTTSPPPASCGAARYVAIDQTLTASGTQHQMTTDATSFVYTMRTGLYDTLWIAQDQAGFGDATTAEIAEVVHNGATLIVDGAPAQGNAALDLIGGVASRGTVAANESVNLNGPLYATLLNLTTNGAAQTLTLTGTAQSQGTFVISGASPQASVAVASNSVGSGHTLIVGFDLGATLANQSAAWSAPFNATLTALTPVATVNLTPGQFLPVQTGIVNQGMAVAVDVQTIMPSGASYLGSIPVASVAANDAKWDFNLAVAQSNPLYLTERAPATSGSYALQTTVSTVSSGVTTAYGQPLSLAITVTPAATHAANAIASLQGLTLSATADQNLRTSLIAAINAGMSNFNLNTYTGYNVAIAGLINAVDSLPGFSAAGAAALPTVHNELDAIVQEAQWRWTMTQPEASTTLATDKSSYQPNDSVSLSDSVTNINKNAVLTNLTVTTAITDANGATVLTKSESLAQLAAAAQQPYSYTYAVNNGVPGSYSATVLVKDANGNTLSQSSASFTVLSTAVTGVGLSGTVQVTPQQVPVGSTAQISFTLSDQGNSAVANVPLTVSIVNSATQQVLAQLPFTGSVNVGAVFNGTGNWTASGGAGSTYQAVLSASIGGQTLTLAQTTFSLITTPVKLGITQSLWNANRVLVLTACSTSNGDNKQIRKNEEGSGSGTGTCTAARYVAIDKALTSMGLQHAMTTDAAGFTFAMRTGLYDTLWIASDQSVFGDALTAEVSEVVFGGATLIVDGAPSLCNANFDLLGGIKSRTSVASNENVTLNGSFYPSVQTLVTTGSAQSLNVTGTGLVQGTFKVSGSGSSAQTVAALVSNQVGAGRTLIAGFDLGTTLSTQATAWAPTLNTTFTAITPLASASLTPGEVLPLQTSVVNQGIATSAEVQTVMPAGALYLGSTPAATLVTSSNAAKWDFSLALTQTEALYLTMRAPGTGGSYSLQTNLGTVSGTTVTPYGNPLPFPITVTPAATNAANAIAGLQAITLSVKADQTLRTTAIADINQAMSNFKLNTYTGYGNAITELVSASNTLAGLSIGSTAAVNAVRSEIDAALQETQWRWTLLQPEVSAALSIDKSTCQPTDTATLSEVVTNITTNTVLSNLSVVTTVTGPTGTVMFSKTESLAQLAVGAKQNYTYGVSLAAAAAGVYQASMVVKDANGNVLAQSSSQFTVASTATTGAGLTGAVQVTPLQVPTGSAATFAISVTDQGNSAVSNLPLTLSIATVADGKVVAQLPFTANVAVGATFAASGTWTVTGSAGTNYKATLSANIGGNTLQLGQGTFSAIAPAVTLNIAQAQSAWQNLLVYSACKRATDGLLGQCGTATLPVDNPATLALCDSNRAGMIDQTLTGLGVGHAVTTSASDFLAKLRSGKFNTYWISNGATVLGEPSASELRAAVTRGNGLIVDGLDAGYNAQLSACAGVGFKAPYAAASEPLTITGGLYAPGSFTINSAPVQLTQLAGSASTSEATIGSGSTAGPGIVESTYGSGKTLAFAFDWATTLGQFGSKAWSAVAQNSMTYVTPAPPMTAQFVAGDVITLGTTIQNAAQTASLQVVMAVPQGATFISASPTSQLSNGNVVWNLNLAAGATQVLTVSLQAPPTAGSYNLGTTVNVVTGSGSSAKTTPYQTTNFAFSVQTAPQLLTKLIAAVQAQSTTTAQQQAAAAAAIDELNQAQAASLAANNNDEALRLLLVAQVRIARIDTSGTLQPQLASLIAAVERLSQSQ
jgi:flagellar hook assembly protein FlgD/fibronectin type 3 domain-containing protein